MSFFYQNCPHCKKEIRGKLEWLNEEVICPFCQKDFFLLQNQWGRVKKISEKKSNQLYTLCPFCKNELIVNTGLLGKIINCQFCKKDFFLWSDPDNFYLHSKHTPINNEQEPKLQSEALSEDKIYINCPQCHADIEKNNNFCPYCHCTIKNLSSDSKKDLIKSNKKYLNYILLTLATILSIVIIISLIIIIIYYWEIILGIAIIIIFLVIAGSDSSQPKKSSPRHIYTGPQGGKYYLTSKGTKVYTTHSEE